MELLIPKKIHYVWLGGGKKSPLMENCIASWSKFCPDYEIIEWNETNFDIESYPIVKAAVEQKNWSLASDVIRLYVLKKYGGIYLDTDVEVYKSFDDLLVYNAFISYEAKYWLGPAVMGAVADNTFIKECLIRYDNLSSIKFSTNPLAVHTYSATAARLYNLKANGKFYVTSDNVAFLTWDYFYPQHYMTHRLTLTENTYAVHLYTSTWHSKSQKRGAAFARRVCLILGKRIFSIFEKMVAKHYRRVLNREYKRRTKDKV